jgi:parvulin-like peptidyl-prolyl isomerase
VRFFVFFPHFIDRSHFIERTNGVFDQLVYQVIYGAQNLIFSLSQIIQLIGANQRQLNHAWESLNQLIEHAVSTFNEMRAIDKMREENEETHDQKQKQKRLRTLRYAFFFGGSWFLYKLLRYLLFRKKSKRLLNGQRPPQLHGQQNILLSGFGYPSYSNYQSGIY